jgi:hypothetical protein
MISSTTLDRSSPAGMPGIDKSCATCRISGYRVDEHHRVHRYQPGLGVFGHSESPGRAPLRRGDYGCQPAPTLSNASNGSARHWLWGPCCLPQFSSWSRRAMMLAVVQSASVHSTTPSHARDPPQDCRPRLPHAMIYEFATHRSKHDHARVLPRKP